MQSSHSNIIACIVFILVLILQGFSTMTMLSRFSKTEIVNSFGRTLHCCLSESEHLQQYHELISGRDYLIGVKDDLQTFKHLPHHLRSVKHGLKKSG